jgi:membrane dipeptidase
MTITTSLSPAARRLHARAVVADAHNDLLMLVVRREPADWAPYFRRQVLPQLVAGGIKVQILPVFVDDEFRPELALRQMLRMVEAAHRIAEGNGDTVALCTTFSEVATAVRQGRIALVLAIESCAALGESVELVRTMFRLGVRIASFTHMGRTAFADGSGEDAAGSRLTAAGVAAFEEMEQLGMIFDVSHLGRAGVEHVLELATRPLMATHSSAYAVREHHRNLRDPHLRAIAALGGVACVNFYPSFVAGADASLDDVVDHVAHMVDVMGPDAVGLGPDFIYEYYAELSATERLLMIGTEDNIDVVPGMEGPIGLPLVTQRLLDRQFDEPLVEKVLGQNLVDFLRRAMP